MTSKDNIKHIIAVIILLLLVSFALFAISLFATNPTKLGPGGVTFWFIDVLIMSVAFFTLLFYWSQHKRSRYKESKRRCLSVSFRSGLVLGIASTVLLALSSLRSLSWRDFILFIVLISVVELYFRTRKVSS